MSRNPLCVQLDMEFDSGKVVPVVGGSRNPLCVQLDMEVSSLRLKSVLINHVAIRYACN